MTNTLAYYDMAIITAVKSFIVQAHGINCGMYYKNNNSCNCCGAIISNAIHFHPSIIFEGKARCLGANPIKLLRP